ncbi:P27 family phage terminase small subunit [Mesorhizobium loti]|uniref:P27 family phage terminase small subunit n=1 Tax=Rhizobium loti TaxID=381 RepID=UPI00047E3C64|nr:P27 family phage terminase small subunit [Mesorhizobium loti]
MHSTNAQAQKPPANLRPATRKWYKSVISDFDLEGHHIKLLTLAAEAWDQSQIAREVLDKDGQTYTDRFGQPKERPEIAILNASRIAFARLIRELALDGVDSPEAPRGARTADYGRRR